MGQEEAAKKKADKEKARAEADRASKGTEHQRPPQAVQADKAAAEAKARRTGFSIQAQVYPKTQNPKTCSSQTNPSLQGAGCAHRGVVRMLVHVANYQRACTRSQSGAGHVQGFLGLWPAKPVCREADTRWNSEDRPRVVGPCALALVHLKKR